MSAPAAFLRVLAEKLRGAGVPWMLTGSAASSYYGEPRATNDLDIVVDPTPTQIEAFAASLSGSFYVSREEARRGGSDRQLRDAAAVLAANRETLDLNYLRRQGRELRVDDLLGRLLGESGGAPA